MPPDLRCDERRRPRRDAPAAVQDLAISLNRYPSEVPGARETSTEHVPARILLCEKYTTNKKKRFLNGENRSPIIYFLSRADFDNRDQQCGIIDFKDSALGSDSLMVIRIPFASFCRAVRIFR